VSPVVLDARCAPRCALPFPGRQRIDARTYELSGADDENRLEAERQQRRENIICVSDRERPMAHLSTRRHHSHCVDAESSCMLDAELQVPAPYRFIHDFGSSFEGSTPESREGAN
jgi:hypothetical protein